MMPKILLVEDDQIIQEANSMLLELIGCSVERVSKGVDALRVCSANLFDIILLDLGLPDMHGLEVCKAIREDSINQDVPIIAVTAYSHSVKEQCLAAGANSFITKPASRKTLHELLCEWVPKFDIMKTASK